VASTLPWQWPCRLSQPLFMPCHDRNG
jgi:hypothetical protein